MFTLSAWDQVDHLRTLDRLELVDNDETKTFYLGSPQASQVMTTETQDRLVHHRGTCISALCVNTTVSSDKTRHVYILFAPQSHLVAVIGTIASIPLAELHVLIRRLILLRLDPTTNNPLLLKYNSCFVKIGQVNSALLHFDLLGPSNSTFLKMQRPIMRLFDTQVRTKATLHLSSREPRTFG